MQNKDAIEPNFPPNGERAIPDKTDAETRQAVGQNTVAIGDETLCFSTSCGIAGQSDLSSRADAAAGDAIARSASLPTPAGQIRLIRQIAQGGSGEIWEAVQPELQRTVAVKRLRLGTDSHVKTHRQRALQETHFRQEALTAGYLEHPNILPVYDVGIGFDGQALLVMKMVRGNLWNNLINRDFSRLQPLEFLSRHVEILATVTNAVAFAHSKSIIHRDLKPSQVMIGDFDEVLLMDWGLAMAYEQMQPCLCPTPGDRGDSPLFRPVNPAGTVTFMAPEQTVDDLDGLGPWTDVYLLGGILYMLLCGRAPHWTASGRTSLRRDPDAVPPSPEHVAPQGREVPVGLARLAMQCLDRNPKNRPGSAQALRLELLDWLAMSSRRRECDLLLGSVRSAINGPSNEADSHVGGYGRLAEQIAALDRALALVPGQPEATRMREALVENFARAAIVNNDLTLARVQAQQLVDPDKRNLLVGEIRSLQEEFDRQDEQYRAALQEATDARAHTERLRALAEQTVRFLIHDLHQPLKAIGRLDLLRTAADQAMRHFDAATDTPETPDPTIQHNRAIAFLNIGEVLSDEGDKPGALAAFERAVATLDQLAELPPAAHDPRWPIDRARAYDLLARQHYFHGNNARCRELCERAIPILQDLLDSAPEAERHDRTLEMVRTQTTRGFAYWRDRKLDQAMECFQKAVDLARPETLRNPGHLASEQALAQALVGIGNIHRDRAEMEPAIAINEQILQLRGKLSQARKDNVPLLEDVFWTRNNLGLMYQLAGRLEDAETLLRGDISERKAHADAMPGSIMRAALRTFPISLLAETLFLQERLEEAWQTYRIAVELDRRVAENDPSPHFHGALAFNTARLAEVTLSLLHGPHPVPSLPDDFAAHMPWPDAGATPPGATVRAHSIEDVMALAAESLACAERVQAGTPHNSFFCKTLARSLILKTRLTKHAMPEADTAPDLQRALQLLAPLADNFVDPAREELRAAALLCLGQHGQAMALVPFLRQRRWLSPMLRQIITMMSPTKP